MSELPAQSVSQSPQPPESLTDEQRKARFVAKCAFRLRNPKDVIPYVRERLQLDDEEIIDMMQTPQFLEDLDRYKRAYIEVPAYAAIKRTMVKKAIRGDTTAADHVFKGIARADDKVTIEETRRITGTMERLGQLFSGGF